MRELQDDLTLFARVAARDVPLSAAGRARRAAMRGDLVAALVRRRWRRRAARGALAVAAVVLVALLALRWLPAPASDDGARAFAMQHADFAEVRDGDAPLAHVEFAVATGDLRAIEAWSVPTREIAAVTLVDDETVLRLLAEAERRTGLVRAPGGVFFTEDVFDKVGGDGP